ncbi:hypothetical protein, partial [Corallococcus terminator]
MSTALQQLEHTYADAVPDLVVAWAAAPVRDPAVVVRNDALARDLGLDPEALRADGLLTGTVPEGVQTVAMAYS